MSEALIDLTRVPIEESPMGSTYSCPACGSFLDAPRVHPPSGDLARKCAACCDWYRIGRAPSEVTE
jgi:hypothetical protein